ncbi:MAG: ABC transporter ATP-binding protein/permease [Spirochaetia bacterium]|nr:ABC transporter ATP-binding protein/permease [Spirochaetia bacterium]
MNIFLRLMKYGVKYKKLFFIGITLSFLVSIFNAVTLSTLKPIFDVYGQGVEKPFQIQIQEGEWDLLLRGGRYEELKKLINDYDVYQLKKEWINSLSQEEMHLPLKTWEAFSYFLSLAKLKINLITIAYNPFKLIVMLSIGILPIYLLKLLCLLGSVYFLSATGLNMVKDIRTDLYNKLIDLPLGHFVKEKSGVWMSRVINDVVLISDVMANDIRVSISNLFIVITHLMLLAIINSKLLVISLIGVPLLLWPVNYFARKIKSITRNEQSRLADLNGHIHEMIAGVRVIRAFGMEEYEKSRFKKINDMLRNEGFKYRLNNTIGPSLVEFTSAFIIAGLLVYGASQIAGGELTSGSFFTFLFTLLMVLSPLKQLATWYNLMNRMNVAGQRIFELMDEDVPIVTPEIPVELKKIKKSIDFKHVSFHYKPGDRDVLKNLNLQIPVGSTVALVGHSGAGKSTFVDLIPRFNDCTSGEILFDGINIKNLSLINLREKIGIVTQEVFLFNASIRENIAYGQESLDIKEIEKAARLAFAHDFIMELPNGYDTLIGERGFMLSGGQRQRLSIARALLKDPEILIFDEATSALDTRSEKLVQKAIKRMVKNRTTFVIAHRLSTVYESDMILVFKDGKIIETGTHDELLKKSGEYKSLYDLQFQDV